MYWLNESEKAATVNAAIRIARPAVEVMRPPGLRTRNHIERQNPPSRQPRPSVTSLKMIEMPPKTKPVTMAATMYAAWIAFETGGFMT